MKSASLPPHLRRKLPAPTAAAYLAGTAPKTITVVVPVSTVSEANAHEHWRKRQQRAKRQRGSVVCHLLEHRYRLPKLPVRVTLTRLSPRQLDSDNAVGAMKHCRDGVADVFGVDDGDERYEWVVRQEKSKRPGVRITIEPAPPASPATEGAR